ncbi:hypothetical protein GWR56_11000 [Mucilaginibacter sp. 14171R-50]|uniref:DUF922 domain-containing protein n=1 Tax=Mucilaginibacter sp. 14171R-50 TaxID=2703789 RepID=UPI00138C1F44|nr:hypothetical protein [Mucilaginibacter sp. 14171R-50]QHS56037.1 hypothetical protein GWR56_11000 [Mucilaginibacter sp. 14171R-50]
MLRKILAFLWLPLLITGLLAFKAAPLPITYITLQNPALKLTPTEFYISDIIDERRENNTIGSLQPVVNNISGNVVRPYSIDIKGGFTALKNFISNALPANKHYRAVIARLKTLKVTEAPVNGGMVKGDIKLSIAFYLEKADDPVFLVDYNTTTTYQRKPGPAQQIEPLINSALGNSLVYLNNWVNTEAAGNIKLAKGVKVNFTEYTEPIEGDTIYYQVDRPLRWVDFKGRKRIGSKYAAEIFAGLGYDQDAKLVNGIVNVTLAMKVYVPKSACWVNTDALNDYNLTHEQHHFDIARLVAEHFKQKIKGLDMTPDNYEATINMAYIDALREMGDLQKQYDTETGHSANTYQQQLWNKRIDKELADLGIKPGLL